MTDRARILVVEDDEPSRNALASFLSGEGHAITALPDGSDAIAAVRAEQASGGDGYDLIITDWRMNDVDGDKVLEQVQSCAPDTPVILVTANGTLNSAVEAIRGGAYDYIFKPIDYTALQVVVDRALRHRSLAAENRRLKREIRDRHSLGNVVGISPTMLQVYKTAARVAATDATVLVLGESGTGKELVARAIHGASPRAAEPFIAVDCGAIAEGVLESELFGHARGSFTGATGARKGLFEEASGGTLFLDEIGDVGPRIQSQLLRVLQEGEIRRVGESQPVRVNARVVAATNKDLAEAARTGKFREDLYYRLNVVSISLPALRERREDIPLLAEYFASRHAGARGANITTEAREAMMAYDWPGNVRELENAVARALALNPGGTILVDDLPEAVRHRVRAPEPVRDAATDALVKDRPTLDELNRRYADRVLRELGGNKTRAAEALGIDRKTLSRLLGKDE